MGVFGQAHLIAKQIARVTDVVQVGILRPARVDARALEQQDVIPVRHAQGAYGLIQLRQRDNTGGYCDRLARGGDLPGLIAGYGRTYS